MFFAKSSTDKCKVNAEYVPRNCSMNEQQECDLPFAIKATVALSTPAFIHKPNKQRILRTAVRGNSGEPNM
jgi:hypothetical protein